MTTFRMEVIYRNLFNGREDQLKCYKIKLEDALKTMLPESATLDEIAANCPEQQNIILESSKDGIIKLCYEAEIKANQQETDASDDFIPARSAIVYFLTLPRGHEPDQIKIFPENRNDAYRVELILKKYCRTMAIDPSGSALKKSLHYLARATRFSGRSVRELEQPPKTLSPTNGVSK